MIIWFVALVVSTLGQVESLRQYLEKGYRVMDLALKRAAYVHNRPYSYR